jgi:hypothetical protein
MLTLLLPLRHYFITLIIFIIITPLIYCRITLPLLIDIIIFIIDIISIISIIFDMILIISFRDFTLADIYSIFIDAIIDNIDD